jgi:hypothetical protein
LWTGAATTAVVLTLGIMTATTVLAAPGGNGNGNGSGGNNGNGGNGNGNGNPPSLAATPELDSLALFASGAVGMAGYGLLRLRARKR